MAADPARAIALLDGRFLLDHPVDAALEIERQPALAIAATLSAQLGYGNQQNGQRAGYRVNHRKIAILVALA
jgi:hypothetical protein